MATPLSRDSLDIKYTQLFINNQWVNSASGKTFTTINPVTDDVITNVQEGDKADVDQAVEAARAAFALGSTWRRMDASKRGSLIHKFADLVERDLIYIATLNSLDNGRLFTDSVGEAVVSVRVARCLAGYTDKLVGQTVPIDGDFFCYTRREPIGVCAAIIPWNVPILQFVEKLAHALVPGNTLIIKPAEQTPLVALYLASLVLEAGFPPGVVNVIPGYGTTAGSALAHHEGVDKVGFTGSAQVGKLLMQASGQSNLKKVTLELGGKSPNIVFADADFDLAVKKSHDFLFANCGQVCVAASRTYVQEEIYDRFVEKSLELARKKVVGDPFDSKTEMSCLVDADQLKRVLAMIEIGKSEGATLQCGGKRIGSKGCFVEPTIFTDLTDDMTIAREEIFGPVMQIMKFRTLEEVIARANDTVYGLAAYVFTKDINKALTVTNSLQAGIVQVNSTGGFSSNAPFGGYKQSGIGREFGSYGVEEYTELKTVVIKIPSKNS